MIWCDWIPLTFLPGAAFLTRDLVPAWVFMWLFAFALFLGCKWLTWQRALRRGANPPTVRSLSYLFAWPGMNATEFLASNERIGAWNLKFLWSLDFGAWSFALAKTLAGASVLYLAATGSFRTGPLATGWLTMVGIVMFLHFGLFDLLAFGWRSAGVNAQPVMRSPLLATSLADFWSKRWNTAFNALAHQLAFRPLARRWGVVTATMGVFLISGLVHEAVISLPARGGFGLPTAYFVLQGLGVLAERSAWGRRIRLGHGLRGWFFVMGFTAGPVFWLFHPVFINNVILPMLNAFGAN
jgi:hypothetical protein